MSTGVKGTTDRKFQPGDVIAGHSLDTVTGERVNLPDAGEGLTHLQFRRFAGCPICNLHLRSIAVRHEELQAVGIREVAVFHAGPPELLPHVAELPFAVIGDPGKRLYREFGVESAPRALLDPRAWPIVVRAVARGLWVVLRGKGHFPAARPSGGRLGLPADFLITGDGRIVACKYGEHAGDQWSVDDLLGLAAEAREKEHPPAS
jgi:peroxiredoxin